MRYWFLGLQARIAGWRLRRVLRKSAAGNPVETAVYALYDEAAARGLGALTARQQLILATWDARGIISNGGFRYFLEGDRPLTPVAEGFRVLGFPSAADACDRVAAAVAAAPGITERARRAALVAEGFDRFEAEDAAVFKHGFDALEHAIGEFMRQHPRDFTR